MTGDRVVRRLRRLRDWEAVNVALLPAIAVSVWPTIDSRAVWLMRFPALVVVSLILAQGAVYWHVKYRTVRDRRRMPGWFCQAFRRSKTAALGGLLGAGGLLAGAVMLGQGSAVDLAWGVGLLAFATLEYLNYFHLQLMHDSFADWRYLDRHRRLRESPLRTDLRRTCQ